MSARARRRKRSSQGSVGRKVLLGFAVVASIIGIGLASAAIWVLDVAASAPSIDTLKPADSGANSQVFDADGTSLGYVQSDVLRQPVELETDARHPSARRRSRSRTRTSTSTTASTTRRSSAPRSRTSRPARSGRAPRRSPSSSSATSTSRTPRTRSSARSSRRRWRASTRTAYTKDEILEQYLNTASYGTTDGRTAVGVEAASQVFFNKSVAEIERRRGGAARRAAAGAVRLQPVPQPEGREGAPQPGARTRWPARATSPPRRPAKWESTGLGLERGYRYETRERAVLLRLRPAGADRRVRPQDRPPGRAQGLHDARPATFRRSARAGDRRHPDRRRGRTRSSRPTPRPARSSRWPPPTPTTPASSTSPPRATASRARRSSRSC